MTLVKISDAPLSPATIASRLETLRSVAFTRAEERANLDPPLRESEATALARLALGEPIVDEHEHAVRYGAVIADGENDSPTAQDPRNLELHQVWLACVSVRKQFDVVPVPAP